MAKGKVIQYSDIANQNDIDRLKQDLKDIAENIRLYKSELNEVAKVISKNPLKSGKDLQDYNKNINDAVNITENLNTTQQKSVKVSRDYFRSVEALNKQKEKATKSEKEHQEALNKTVRSIEDAKKQNIALRKERDKLDTTTEKGTKKLAELNKKIDENNELIKQNTDSLSKQKIGIGGYKDGIISAAKETKIFGVSINDATSFLSSGVGVITAVTAVVLGLGKAYASSARGAEDLARAHDRLSSITKQIGNSLADATGESNFFDSVLRSTQQTLLGFGSTIKSDVEVALLSYIRKLEILEANQERDKKAQLQRAEQLRQIRDDETKSIEERTTANNALATVINFREEQTIKFQQEKLAAYQSLLKMDKDNIEVQTAIKQIEFEIADAREEAEGYRSEQKMNAMQLDRDAANLTIELEKAKLENQIISDDTNFEYKKQLIEKTRQLQIDAAGENQLLIDIANQNAANALLQLEVQKTQIYKQESEKRIAQAKKEREANNINSAKNIELTGEEIIVYDELKNKRLENQDELTARLNADSKERMQAYEQQTESFAEQAETQGKIDDALTQTKEANWDTVSNVMGLFSELMGENTEAAKAFAIAQTIIDTYRAASAAFAGAQEYPQPYGAILGAALAASAVVSGLARVRAITNTKVPKYYDGTEFVELDGNRKGRDTIPAYLNEGERIVPTEINKALTGISNPELPVLVNLGKMMKEKGFSEMVDQQRRTNDLLRRYKFVDSRGMTYTLDGNAIGLG